MGFASAGGHYVGIQGYWYQGNGSDYVSVTQRPGPVGVGNFITNGSDAVELVERLTTGGADRRWWQWQLVQAGSSYHQSDGGESDREH